MCLNKTRFIPISEPHCNQQPARREVPQIDPEIIYSFQPLNTIVEHLAPCFSETFTHLLKLALYLYLIPQKFYSSSRSARQTRIDHFATTRAAQLPLRCTL